MDATRRLANGARRFQPPGQIPALLVLRGTIGLLALLAIAAGAATPDPPAAAGSPKPVAATAGTRVPASDVPKSAATTRRQRSVFVCDDSGTPVFADRPCGPDLVHRMIGVEHPGGGRVADTVPPVPRASTRPRLRRTDRNDVLNHLADRCTALKRQLDELDDRMRTGYSSREAARLWEHRRALKDGLRSAGC
jgi:hypothetical protein